MGRGAFAPSVTPICAADAILGAARGEPPVRSYENSVNGK